MRRDLYMNSVLTQYLRHIYVPAKQLVDLNLMKIAYKILTKTMTPLRPT